jgi:hypothetical protein
MDGRIDRSRKLAIRAAEKIRLRLACRQIKYKNILKAHGLEITGNERYTKTADDATATTTTKTTTKRKASENLPSPKKITKKVKSGDDGGDVGEDDKEHGDEGHDRKEDSL